MNFIKKHLIDKIKKEVNRKQDSVNFNGFFYFDSPISYNIGKNPVLINRINRERFYQQEEILPLAWNIKGGPLMEIFFKIKNDEFYFYKKVNDKEHKIRFKKNEYRK
jgi:hypothetical protein